LFPFLQIIPLILVAFLQAFQDPQFLPLYLVVVAVIAVQYNRMEKIRESFFGVRTRRAGADILAAAGFGLIGGLAGSLVLIFVGLTISGELYYLWPVAILLMLVDMRFLCFAYAGGILALSNLLLGFPRINVPQIIALVAILHMVESFLILAGGHLGAVPAYVKTPENRVIGGFTLQKFWPIPIIALAVGMAGTVEGGIDMPAWWPLIKPDVPGNPESLVYFMLPLVAGLGYGDIAIARSPVEKSRLSSFYLGVYSVLLLILAVLAGQSRTLALTAAVFSPLGHEAVVYIGRRLEFKGEPLYVPPDRGMKILDVIPYSPAWRAGLRSGDVIYTVNGRRLAGRYDFYERLQDSSLPLMVDFFSRSAGTYKIGKIRPPGWGKSWGVIPVPEGEEAGYFELQTTGLLGRWLKTAWKRITG